MINEGTAIRAKVRQKLRFMLLAHNIPRKKSNILAFIMPENRHSCSTLMDIVCYYTLLLLVLEFQTDVHQLTAELSENFKQRDHLRYWAVEIAMRTVALQLQHD